jgi:DNA-binding NarL/FixJ family response regulator
MQTRTRSGAAVAEGCVGVLATSIDGENAPAARAHKAGQASVSPPRARATGESAGKRTVDRLGELTPLEPQIAGVAQSGMSTPGIAAELFLNPRTVRYHLRKVFSQLDITSRRQLRQALPGSSHDGPMTLPAPDCPPDSGSAQRLPPGVHSASSCRR